MSLGHYLTSAAGASEHKNVEDLQTHAAWHQEAGVVAQRKAAEMEPVPWRSC